MVVSKYTYLFHLLLIKVYLDESWTVLKSNCECPMGNHKCHHVAAALLYGYVSSMFCRPTAVDFYFLLFYLQ